MNRPRGTADCLSWLASQTAASPSVRLRHWILPSYFSLEVVIEAVIGNHHLISHELSISLYPCLVKFNICVVHCWACRILCDSAHIHVILCAIRGISPTVDKQKAIDDVASSIAFHIFPHIRTLSSPFRPGRSLRSGLQFWPRFTFRLRRHETISHFQRRRQIHVLTGRPLAGDRIGQGENRNARKLVLVD